METLSPDAILAIRLFKILIAFLIVVLILWFLLPFAVFGIKDRLDRMIKMHKQTQNTLEQIAELIAEQKKLEEIRTKSLRTSTQNSNKNAPR